MGPAAHECPVVSSIPNIQEGRPEERVVTMELLSFCTQQPFLRWFPASCDVLVSVDSFRMQKGVSPCLLKSFSLFSSVQNDPLAALPLLPSALHGAHKAAPGIPSAEPLRDPPKSLQLGDGCCTHGVAPLPAPKSILLDSRTMAAPQGWRLAPWTTLS